jgi:hypothetical protein
LAICYVSRSCCNSRCSCNSSDTQSIIGFHEPWKLFYYLTTLFSQLPLVLKIMDWNGFDWSISID